jgi:hypothetical protein
MNVAMKKGSVSLGLRIVLPAVLIALGLQIQAHSQERHQSASPTVSVQHTATQDALSEAVPGEAVAVPGFLGSFYNSEKASGKVVVIATSLARQPGNNWGIDGLLRNETTSSVRNAKVQATVRDVAGRTIGVIDAWLPLATLRAGEPVPFVVSSSIQRALVGSVDWSIAYEFEPATKPGSLTSNGTNLERSFAFEIFWERQFGSDDRLTGYPYTDPARGPYPYVLLGSIHNDGPLPVTAARVLAAWVDPGEHVVHTAWLRLRPAAFSLRPMPSAAVQPGDQVDFYYHNDDPLIAPLLRGTHLMLWGVTQ